MSGAHEVYRVTISPGGRTMEATARLAKTIINRWLPGNAGGAVILAGPQLCNLLHPLFERAQATRRAVTIRVDTMGVTPVITEEGT